MRIRHMTMRNWYPILCSESDGRKEEAQSHSIHSLVLFTIIQFLVVGKCAILRIHETVQNRELTQNKFPEQLTIYFHSSVVCV